MKNKTIFMIGCYAMMAGMAMATLDRVSVNTMGEIIFGAGFVLFLEGIFG